ncbi:MAG: hypothetical protein OXC92_06190 [Flavobacteriaceae bacterium]|nr:hypothetical protein [Flavobacteriaceae bacterium]MCY4216554.1 hypothetical protein [Flavobacteriaceae bacterium]MCY4254325.1 hypothetical protein [Flavobacteriaceae bacterium]
MHKRGEGYLIFVLLLISNSCGLFNQQYYHKIASNYNLLYNGNKSLELGIEKLNQDHVPNFYDISLIDRTYSNELSRYFSFAENRATTVLELHTIENKPIWEQSHILKAHLMLLKSCYFQNKEAPNLEFLNQIEFQKVESSLEFELLYWIIKTLLTEDQNQEAIQMIKEFQNSSFIGDAEKSALQKLLAQAYLDEKDYELASKVIQKILDHLKKNQFRTQFTFANVLVQLNQYDKAMEYFKRLANQNSNPLYALHGKLAIIKYDQNLSDQTRLIQYNELLENKNFRKFDYYIHNKLGNHFYSQNQFQKAKEFFLLSNHSQRIDRFTIQNNLNSIYRMELEAENFIDALASLNAITKYESSNDTLLIHQRNSLVKLIDLDHEIKMIIDSIDLTVMTEKELNLHFNQNLEKTWSLAQSTTTANNSSDIPINRELLEFLGDPQIFKNQWGERPNRDNWRYGAFLEGTYQQRVDFSSTQITLQEKEILWSQYKKKVFEFKNDLVDANQQITQKTIELIHLYRLFGLIEQSKALLERREIYFSNTENTDSYYELENKLEEL